MQSALDINTLRLELLKSLEPETVSQTLGAIVNSFANPQAIAILLWDPDFECMSEKHQYFLGSKADDLRAEVNAVMDSLCRFDDDERAACELPGSQLRPLTCHKLVHDGEPVAVVLVAGDKELTPAKLENHLDEYPVAVALANCFEVAELKREVERLREQYEQLEQDLQEERRIAVANGVATTGGGSPAKFRLEQSDKEKLVYEISNAVRSSLDVQEVLQTAVSKIGETFKLSRCLVIWPMPESDEFTVYEYHAENVVSVIDLFKTPAGETFVRRANEKTAPHDFCDESDQTPFDVQFLREFAFLSGMLVPLIYQDRNIGSLFLQDCDMPREWSIDNTALIGSVVDLVTVAIEHANMHEEKKRQAVTDGLTGIANRRHFNETLEKEFVRAKRYGNELSLVLVDMDYLKKVNDTYGHPAGDAAIRAIGSALSSSCRSVDLAARYGGEEFCLLLPDTGMSDAMNLAERVRRKIEQTHVEGPTTITASIGVATFPSHCTEPGGLLEAADQALYAAKQGGRNRVVTAESLPAKQ
ncbi:MAG TPA: sensor domain-containing diguanylate cyclase [Candidatus Obscuribacterales bacterium]